MTLKQETIVLKKMMQAGWLCLVVCVASAPRAQAQTVWTMVWTDKAFVNVNLGAQTGSRSLATESQFELYRETARIDTTQDVKGGALFDVSGGYKVWRNLTVGLGYSRVASDADVSINATIPDPLIFDSLRSVTASASGANHSEQAVHVQATWMVPVTDKVDVGLSLGPSIFSVKQDVTTAVDVREPGPTLSPTTFTERKETAAGFNIGLDVNYLLTPRLGAGLLARYTRGSVQLDGARDKLTVGGFQIGVGVRVRY